MTRLELPAERGETMSDDVQIVGILDGLELTIVGSISSGTREHHQAADRGRRRFGPDPVNRVRGRLAGDRIGDEEDVHFFACSFSSARLTMNAPTDPANVAMTVIA
jgi:hypothetical protein